MKKTTEAIVRLMFEKYTTDISIFSDTFLHNTISNRMTLIQVQQPAQYLHYLQENPYEARLLSTSLTNSYSIFYRNPLTFAFIYQFVMPRIITEKAKSKDQEIRIWSAGCASGQEAYSLAMIADDLLKNSLSNCGLRIFATDNLLPELETARRGIYNSDDIKNLPFRFVENYISKKGTIFTIAENIKKFVEFSDFDLLDRTSLAPPASIFGDFDLIICCNVLFYYKSAFQKIMLEKFFRSLSEGGFLVTGEAETGIVNATIGFRNYLSSSAVFVKK